MKKYRYLFLVFLTAIMSGLYLISCGGDGDGDSGNGGSGDGGQGSTTSSIIGTWEMSISGSVEHTVMLCANGIGYFFDEESYDFNIDKFEYIYNKKTEKINIIFWNGQTEVYEIEAIGNDKMIIIRDLDSSKYFCKKINSPYTASQLEKIFQKKYGSDDSDNSDEGGGGIITTSSIVGTWLNTSNSDGTEEEYTMFCADGTAYIYFEHKYGLNVDKFSYIYNAEKAKIIWTKHGVSESFTDDIRILTDNKLVLETHSGNFSNTETYKKTTPTYTAAQLEEIYKGGGIITASSIVGTWLNTSNSDGTEEYTMFCADGTAYFYYEDSNGFEVEKFSYIYNAEKGKIIWIEDGSSDTWSDDIKILTDSKLILETHSGNFSNTETYKKTTPTYTAAQLENIYKAQSQKSSN